MEREHPPDEPTNLAEWLWRIKRYEDGIFVRHHARTVALSELDPKSWGEVVARWLDAGMLPVRIREPEELENDAASSGA